MREMKDSGIEWIGEIPKSWGICKIKYNLHRAESRNPGNMQVLSLYRDYGVIPKDSRDDNHNITSEDTTKYKYVQVGNFVINKMKAWQGSVAVSEHEGIVSPAYYVYQFDNDNMNKRYFHYLIRSCYKDEFRRLSGGIREGQWDLPSEALDNTFIVIPSEKEQTLIIKFLDTKCAEIDALSADIQKEIETLQEYRKSVITEAVTKGLDPDVEMKDSNLSWIGVIPEDWHIIRIKFCSTLKGRIGWQGLTTAEYTDEGPYLVTGVDFKNGSVDWIHCNHVNVSRWEEDPYIQINNGDLLITKDGTVGKVAIVSELKEKATLNSGVLLIRPTRNVYDARYLYWVLCSDVFKKWFADINAGNSTIIHLYQGDFFNFSFPLPNLEKQRNIVSLLDSKCSEIDSIIADKQKQLETLAEYRKSLIYEYVTGKKEVPTA